MELSRATIGRLPIYLDYLKHLPTETKTISATSIAKALNLGDVQVRKDLSAACGLGRPKIGYEVTELTRALEATIGEPAGCEAVIVGAGRLGRALLGFGGFSEYGLTVTHAFDLLPNGIPLKNFRPTVACIRWKSESLPFRRKRRRALRICWSNAVCRQSGALRRCG